jgi:hypothetical protein
MTPLTTDECFDWLNHLYALNVIDQHLWIYTMQALRHGDFVRSTLESEERVKIMTFCRRKKEEHPDLWVSLQAKQRILGVKL